MTDAYYIVDGATDQGLWYEPDLSSPSPVHKQTFTGGKSVRRVAGVTNGVAVLRSVLSGSSMTYTDNLTSGLGAKSILDEAFGYFSCIGAWSASGGRTDGGCVTGTADGDPGKNGASVTVDLGREYTVTAASFYHLQSTSGDSFSLRFKLFDGDGNDVFIINESTQTTSTSWRQEAWTGTKVGVRYIQCAIAANTGNGDPVFIDELSVTYEGKYTGELKYSSNNGTAVNTITIPDATYQANVAQTCFDVDDYDLGVLMVGTGGEIHYTQTYADANTVKLSGLDGEDKAAAMTCVRVPYRKLLTQALNDDASTLQFIYCTDRQVGGHTIFAANFNAATGAIVGTQSTLTPEFSGTKYYVIGKDALETWGNNTQRIIALCKPVGGSVTRLFSSINGAGSWNDLGAADYLSCHFVSPAAGGNGSVITLTGADGIPVSFNLGSTLQNKIGDFVAELSSATPLGAFIY